MKVGGREAPVAPNEMQGRPVLGQCDREGASEFGWMWMVRTGALGRCPGFWDRPVCD